MRVTCGACALLNNGRPLAEGQVCAPCRHRAPLEYPFADVEGEPCGEFMPAETTLDDLTWPLMMGHSVVQPYCCVCGRADRLNLHHVVRRGGGNLYYAGRPLEKPVLTLCGSGTEGCHGRAHQMELHFRWAGRWEYLDTGVPTKYQRALVMDGWRPIREGEL